MDDWRIPLGLVPLRTGFALLGLDAEFDSEVLRSLGLGGLVWGSLVLAFGNRTRE